MELAPRGCNGANRPRRVRARERDRRAVELRAAGLTFAAIGAELGVTGEAARQAVNRALEATAHSIAKEAGRLRALEAERLDRAAAVLLPEVEAGSLRAHEVWLRNRTRYAALLGLDLRSDADVSTPLTVVLTGTARADEAPEDALGIDNRLPWERGTGEDPACPPPAPRGVAAKRWRVLARGGLDARTWDDTETARLRVFRHHRRLRPQIRS
jgi:hypothetical protein